MLFLFMGAASLRAALAARSDEWMTAGLYLLAIGLFASIAALFHYAAFYRISSERIRIASGWGAGKVREIPLDQIRSVTVRRDVLNPWFNVGTLVITPREDRREPAVLKGIPDPDRLKQRLDWLAGLQEPARSA